MIHFVIDIKIFLFEFQEVFIKSPDLFQSVKFQNAVFHAFFLFKTQHIQMLDLEIIHKHPTDIEIGPFVIHQLLEFVGIICIKIAVANGIPGMFPATVDIVDIAVRGYLCYAIFIAEFFGINAGIVRIEHIFMEYVLFIIVIRTKDIGII